MRECRSIIVGGGAAGIFAAITCAEACPGAPVTVLEKGPQFLSKVRISGGGRCNVTHACFEPRELSSYYPRGGAALLGPFGRFQPRDTVAWFEGRGVKLKTEADGRIFPTSDSSQTVVDCLLGAAHSAGVEMLANHAAAKVTPRRGSGFELELADGEKLVARHVLLATGGCRVPAAGQLARSLGHTLETPVPSLFTFHVSTSWMRELAGISVPSVEVSVPELRLREQGPLLLTHSGLSGPAILKLSAWGARAMHERNYGFALRLNWLPRLDAAALAAELEERRRTQPARFIVNSSIAPLPARLWERLVMAAGIRERNPLGGAFPFSSPPSDPAA